MTSEQEVRYIARQPIFDASRALFAYELLFRDADVQQCRMNDGDRATLSTIDLSLFAGAESLTDGCPAFINCTRELLVNGTMTALPRDRVVLEILETVPPDREVLSACADLRRAGYRLAVDDFNGDESRGPLIALSEFIKVDFALTTPEQRREISKRYSHRGQMLLAEKVETQEDFEAAAACGYRYFQGFFFCKPVTLVAQDVRCLHPAYASLLATVYDKRFDVDAIDRAIRQEPSLCYRLLRYLNSAAFGVYPVRSIRHALTLLGQRELQKWISIVTAIALAGPRTSELIRTALHRACFAEMIANRVNAPYATEFFLAGIFSLMDALLNQNVEQLATSLPLSPVVKEALAGRENPITTALELAAACERGDWAEFSRQCAAFRIGEPEGWACYEESRRWVRSLQATLG